MYITLVSDQFNHSCFSTHFIDQLLELLSTLDFKVTTYEVNDQSRHHCIGCFNCWLKTPGECIINDTSRQITKSVIQSDLVIWFTPIIYGGYSAPMKQVIDRLIPVILPFFTINDGELHHKKRYKHYPSFMVIGYGEDLLPEEIQTFHTLQQAMQRNMYSPKLFTYVFQTIQEGENILKEISAHAKNSFS